MIYAIHNAQLHAGVNATLTALQQNYWIPAARQIIRQLLKKCLTCQRVIANPYRVPDPPPLAVTRTQASRPFQVTGVDFTWVFYVRSIECEKKVYVCLFTCAVTRVVHLEVVTDLSIETFLLALRRFSSRRSTPSIMMSDNASTYLAQLMNCDSYSPRLSSVTHSAKGALTGDLYLRELHGLVVLGSA